MQRLQPNQTSPNATEAILMVSRLDIFLSTINRFTIAI